MIVKTKPYGKLLNLDENIFNVVLDAAGELSSFYVEKNIYTYVHGHSVDPFELSKRYPDQPVNRIPGYAKGYLSGYYPGDSGLVFLASDDSPESKSAYYSHRVRKSKSPKPPGDDRLHFEILDIKKNDAYFDKRVHYGPPYNVYYSRIISKYLATRAISCDEQIKGITRDTLFSVDYTDQITEVTLGMISNSYKHQYSLERSFFLKNYVNNAQIPKDSLHYRTVFWISRYLGEIYDFLRIKFPKQSWSKMEAVANTDTGIDDLFLSERLVLSFLYNFGYLANIDNALRAQKYKTAPDLLVNYDLALLEEISEEVESISKAMRYAFSGDPGKEDFENKFARNFLGTSAYFNPLLISKEVKFQIITQLLTTKCADEPPFECSEEVQRLIVIIFSSFDTEDADFVISELRKVIWSKPLFWDIYEALDDNLFKSMGIQSLFFDHPRNKGQFMGSVYNMWLMSNYSPYKVDLQNTPAFGGFNTNFYFLTTDGLPLLREKFHLDLVSEYEFEVESTENPYLDHIRVDKSTINSVEGVKLEYNYGIHFTYYSTTTEEKREVPNAETGFWNGNEETLADKKVTRIEQKLGDFDIFHPLFITGYDANLELKWNNNGMSVPACFFYYVQEFDHEKEFWAKVNFGIEAAVELAILFASLGSSSVSYLRHIPKLTRIGRAMTVPGAFTGGESIAIFASLSGNSAAITGISSFAGILSSYGAFVQTTANDPATAQLAAKLSLFFGVLAIASGVASSRFAKKAKGAAGDALTEINQFPSSMAGISDTDLAELKTIFSAILGKESQLLAQFTSKMDSLFPSGSNNIYPLVNAFTDDIKLLFWKELGHLDNLEYWSHINNNAFVIGRWKELLTRGLSERLYLREFLEKDTIYNQLLRLTDDTALKTKYVGLKLGKMEKYKLLYHTSSFDTPTHNLLKAQPIALDLMKDCLRLDKKPYRLLLANTTHILKAQFSDDIVDLITEINKVVQEDVTEVFKQKVKHPITDETQLKNTLRDFYNQHDNSFNGLPTEQLDDFKEAFNHLNMDLLYKQGSNWISEPTEFYLSGSPERINAAKSNTNIPVVPSNSTAFSSRANEVTSESKFLRNRINDTEPKAILNFMMLHITKSNEFKMTFTSKIYPCKSCQQFIVGFMNYAEKKGILLEVEVIAHPKATGGTKFTEFISN